MGRRSPSFFNVVLYRGAALFIPVGIALFILRHSRQIRARAIVNLTTFIVKKDACSNILLAKKYGVRQWLIDGYTNLVVQPAVPIFDELYENGIDTLTLAKIYYIRNVLGSCKASSPHSCTQCNYPCRAATGSAIPHNCGNNRSPCYHYAYCSNSHEPTDADRETYKQSAHEKIMEVFSSELSQLEVWFQIVVLLFEFDHYHSDLEVWCRIVALSFYSDHYHSDRLVPKYSEQSIPRSNHYKYAGYTVPTPGWQY